MNIFDRRRDIKNEFKKIFIYCEWKKTEVLYFKWFSKKLENEIRRRDIAIIIEWTGRSNLSIVDYTINEISKNSDFDKSIDEVWVVFDEDTVWKWKFDNSIVSAKANWIKVAYSNECFELWYLLHFEYFNSWIGRKEYYKKLSKTLGCSYEKNHKNIYELIEKNQWDAIKRAKKLLKLEQYKNLPISKHKPSTTVHLLVKVLNSLKDD